MPSYFYKAKKSSAETVTGHLEAAHPEEALELIHQMGLVPVSLEESSQGVLVRNIRPRKIKAKEVYQLTKQLGGLVKSGVSLLKALEVISNQTKNVYLARIISEIASSVRSGRSFSLTLRDYPEIFSPLYVAMVQAGEEIGHLRDVLLDVAEFQKKQQDLLSKVTGAMIYPAVMLSVGILTIFFILTFVLPKIAVIYTDTAQALPLPTLVIMKISAFLNVFWIPIVVGTSLAVFFINRWRKTASAKIMIGGWILRTPFLREFVLKIDFTRFTRTTHLLLNSGLTLVRSMEVAIPTISNPQLREDLTRCITDLKSGESLGNCLNQSLLVPDTIRQMLAVAEEGGSLQESLKDIAESYEADINESIRVMTTLLEPLMILSVGLIVGFIVFAMLLPIFSMDILAH
ncbi:MAG: type II secretion system F family protein [Candidatus Omnitrophica bacterium]|nr:type II secretion system F family protein [Candidatus Omnitrophota bacterium]